MAKEEALVVKLAGEYFRKGEYQQARRYYQQAAQRYGQPLFANSIRLCDLRMNLPAATIPLVTNHAQRAETGDAANPLERQLSETQQLLEHYYTRCQALEYQLQDKQ